MISEGFKNVTQIQDSKKISDRCLHVNSVAGLIQAIGYIKWMVAHATTNKESYGVVFRGQNEDFPSMAPALYRDIRKTSAKPKKDTILKQIINSLIPPHGDSIEEYLNVDSRYLEPLLQHYGVKTSWLDVVDNIWVALWFACHRYFGTYKPLVSFSMRPCIDHDKANIKKGKMQSQEKYCYIALLSVPLNGDAINTGHYETSKAEIIDLRYCVPSFYLRPHTQHGLVMRMKTKTGAACIDFKEAVEAVIRIDLSTALNWIREDVLLSTRNLFPPPHIDTGLSLLLGIPQLYSQLDLPTA